MLKNSKWMPFLISFLLLVKLSILSAQEVITSEALMDDEMATYKIDHYQEKIHPKYEKFDFTVSYHWEENKGFQGGNPASIQVAGEGGQFLQTIDVNWVSVGEPNFYIRDLNFDGYKDLLLLVSNTSPRGSRAYRGWIWNKKKKEFEEFAEALPINLVIDQEKKQILSTEVWLKGRNYRIFEFQGKQLVKIGDLDIDYPISENGSDPDRAGDPLQQSQIHLGRYMESRFKKEQRILNSEMNFGSVEDANYKEVLKRYYSPKSFWRLNDSRWYQSGDGLGIIKGEKDIQTKMDRER